MSILQLQRVLRDNGIDIAEQWIVFDENNDGVLTLKEFRNGLRTFNVCSFTDEQIHEMYGELVSPS